MSEKKYEYASKLFVGAFVYALGVLAFNMSTFCWVAYLALVAGAVTCEVVYQQSKCAFVRKGKNIPHCTLLVASAWVGVFMAYELGSSRRGTAILAIIFSMVVAFDTFSQVIGVIWDKFGTTHPIAPNESENKTEEGFFGGCIASSVTGVFLLHFLDNRLALNDYQARNLVVIMMILPIVAYFGDINESMAKRRLYERKDGKLQPLKDFSRILYTVGGVCERYDGQLAAMSVAGSIAWWLLL